MARGALGEPGLWSDDAIERQLSHSQRNNVHAAYIHTSEHLDERRLMVQWWANNIDANKKCILALMVIANKNILRFFLIHMNAMQRRFLFKAWRVKHFISKI